MPKERTSQSVRIISGKFRGRKLQFPDLPGLRPTLGRTRETLFNWLQADVVDARCLDLFAGSGALGFEALSRGAASVAFVEQHHRVCQSLRTSAQALQLLPAQYRIEQQDSVQYLQRAVDKSREFNLIFADPPFSSGLLEPTLRAIAGNRLLSKDGYLYFECEVSEPIDTLIPPELRCHRHRTGGDYQYGLLQLS